MIKCPQNYNGFAGFLIGFFLCISLVSAQKVIEKSIVNSNISLIQIDAINCFQISLETSPSNEMSFIASIEGEYKKDLLLNIKQEGSTLIVNPGFESNFINPNDKLSAHKVVSIALKIGLPKHKSVGIFGGSCNVSIKGSYENLKVVLNDGSCDIDVNSEQVEISTQSGNITSFFTDAVIFAETKYGKIVGEAVQNDDIHYYLRSITGDILLKRVK